MSIPYRDWPEERKERHRAAVARYQAANRTKVREWKRDWMASHPEQRAKQREYNRAYYAMTRRRQIAKARTRYRRDRPRILAVQRDYRARRRLEQVAAERAIALMMEEVERDATGTDAPDPERLGIFAKQKRPDKRAVGTTPARTVALRLMARTAEPLLDDDDPASVMAAARGRRERRSAP